ncbi:protein indeterminate-domain 12-like [Senna tora]|uniref:Protein indeterminate-domain 12-like n=1 Tax=Senna tora TaxID=362788 RepID=A0A834TBA3_9FABA|nr:protein indeterminate-domain 12-like [Senna tora]
MFSGAMSNSTTSLSQERPTTTTTTRLYDLSTGLNPLLPTTPIPPPHQPQKIKKKRSLPGNPDPDAEVIALSPKTLLATNRFVCEICNKGFQRDQNLQLHRRGHNLPWKLKQRNSKEVKKRAYVCPEASCVHHNPARALGDLTGIKKHYCRKHGEKKWKCDKCSKIYAVHSDWKAHSKTCGTREYRCDCGTLFSRKDSFITHRAFCDALAEESARVSANQLIGGCNTTNPLVQSLFLFPNPWDPSPPQNPNPLHHPIKPESHHFNNLPTLPPPSPSPSFLTNSLVPFPNLHVTTSSSSSIHPATSPHLSATALLQKAATVGAHPSDDFGALHSVVAPPDYTSGFTTRTSLKSEHLTRDFLGLTGDAHSRPADGDVMTFTGDMYQQQHHSLFKSRQAFGFVGTTTAPETWGNY